MAASLSSSDAARRLGVSAKALRLYEQHRLVVPGRTAAGWRVYAPADMARAEQVVALRRLGLSLARIGRVLGGDAAELDAALAQHEALQEARMRELAGGLAALRALRHRLARGEAADAAALGTIAQPGLGVAFDLPWPWGGEHFELRDLPPLTFLTGPLGSGKTRLARRLAEALPGATFLGLDRRPGEAARAQPMLDWLAEDGATISDALRALVGALADRAGALVVDMVEQGLDQATQEALIAHLRLHPDPRRPLVLMTRSSAILDLGAVGPGEAIILCPANHSPPMPVLPVPGSPGYEALASCLASPEVRARSEGVIAWRPGPQAA